MSLPATFPSMIVNIGPAYLRTLVSRAIKGATSIAVAATTPISAGSGGGAGAGVVGGCPA